MGSIGNRLASITSLVSRCLTSIAAFTTLVGVFTAPAQAQDTYTLAPLPAIIEPQTLSHTFFTEPTVTPSAGSVAIRIVDDFNSAKVYTGSVSLVPPASVSTFLPADTRLQFTPPAVFTVQHTLTGFRTVRLQVLSTSTVTFYCNEGGASFPCTIDRMDVNGGVASQSMNIQLETSGGSRVGTFFVRVTFRWRVTAGCPAPTVAAKDSSQRNAEGGCAKQPDLALDHVELVQSVQQYIPNDTRTGIGVVPLIRGRQAIARLFVRSVGEDPAQLPGVRGQAVLVNAVQACNGENKAEPFLILKPAPRSMETIAGVQIEVRGQRNSLDFVIPEAYMCTDSLKIQADVWLVDANGQRTIIEIPAPNNSLEVTWPVQASAAWPDTFNIGVASICTPHPFLEAPCPGRQSGFNLKQWFPARKVRVYPVYLPKLTIEEDLLESRTGMYEAMGAFYYEYLRARQFTTFSLPSGAIPPIQPVPDQLIFDVFQTDRDKASAEKFFNGFGGLKKVWLVRTGVGAYNFDTQAAHGIGHNFGLNDYTGASPLDRYTAPVRPYGWDSNGLAPGFIGIQTIPASPVLTTSGGTLYRSLMDTSLEVGAWVSPGEFKWLFDNGPLQAAPIPQPPSPETLIVSGTISPDAGTGTIKDAVRAPADVPPPASDPNGDTCVEATRPSGLDTFCFTATVLNLPQIAFAQVMPFFPGTTQVKVKFKGKEVASLTSGVPPTVSIASPAGGETWQGKQTIRWTASGNSPTFAVLYSFDDGASWLPLSPTLKTTEFAFDTKDIIGGERVRFRVLASSGLETTTATSGTVRVTQSPVLTPAATEIRFSNLRLGEEEYADLPLTNTGDGRLLAAASRPDNPDFTIDGPSADILGHNETFTLRVRFAPTAVGLRDGTLRIGDTVIALHGAGLTNVAPSLTLPTKFDFGEVPTGKQTERTISISNTGSAPLTVTAIAASGAGYSAAAGLPLTIQPGLRTDVTLRISTGGAGPYLGQLIVSSDDPSHPQVVAALTATASTAAFPAATAAGVLNAGSSKGGAIAPGEIITISGSNVGPADLSKLALVAPGKVGTSLGGTRVLFDDVPGAMIYARAGQASVVVPYSVAGQATTKIVVEYQGRRSDPIVVSVAAAAPALLSADSSGTGPGAILNQNNGANSAQNPAAKGSVIQLFGTGEGLVDPPNQDGDVVSGLHQTVLQPVTATIGGVSARVLFAGSAPSLVAGVLQVNLEVPVNAPSGNQPVLVNIGGFSTQTGLTVAIGGTAAATPTISFDTTSLDFGTVTVGQTKDVILAVRNTGSANLNVSFLSSSNARFTPVGVTPPITVAPGSSQNLTFRFTPTAAGQQTGTITVSSNDPTRPSVTLNISGTGVAAGGGGGGTAAGTTVLTFDVAGLGNGGAIPQAYGDNVTAAVMGNYSYGGQASTPNVTVQYLSHITGAGGDLQWWSNGYGNLQNVIFNDPDGDTGYRVVLAAAAGSTVTLNSFDVASFGTLTLPGLQVLDASGAPVLNRTNVSVPSTSHQTITGPWTSTTLTIVVNTTGLGDGSDNIALDNISFTQSGSSGGGGTTPAIEATPTALDFGSVAVGQSTTKTITVKNTGTGALTVSFLSSSNAQFAPIDSFPPFTIQPGASQTMTFRFTPTSAAAATGTITISSNDPVKPSLTVNVSGTGTASSNLPAITFGQTINGALTTATTRRSLGCTGCYADLYEITVSTTRNIDIRLNSTAFDAFLTLIDSTNRTVTDDDSGGNLNSRINGLLNPGVYRIEVSTAEDGKTGAYTLSVAQ